MMDKLKYLLVLLVVIAAIGGFYYYADASLLMRVLAMLAALGVATAIMLQTNPGRQAWGFFGDSWLEARKVVWPTRKETVQTTMIVMAMVVVVATILWTFDLLLTWAVKLLTGQGG